MAQQIQLRRDTAANWTSVNPVLAVGEAGFETDTGKLKLGNGTSAWSALTYFGGGAGDVSGKMDKSANLSDVANAATARSNLGLGSAATQAWTAFDAAGAAAAVAATVATKAPIDDPAFTTKAITPQLGVNATPDATNRLSVSSPASLLNHAGNGHQVKVNKNAAADTASFLFQTGFSGRAEMGTTGDDDFHFKVSADGSTWKEALKIDKSTGKPSFPLGAGQIQVDVFAASGTWTKPAWARIVTVFCIGGGGGGGSGRKGAAGAVRSAGGGGAGGVKAMPFRIAASLVGATETVTIGAGGTGGAAQTTNSSNGNNGTSGGETTFGAWLRAKGGPGGGGGTATGGTLGTAVAAGIFAGSGTAGSSTGGQPATNSAPAMGAGGGSGGGGITSGDSATNGGAGAPGGLEYGGTLNGGTAGTTSGTRSGGNGDGAANLPFGGAGGGGGAGSTTNGTNAGDGGNGGAYGGGGGGGGAGLDGANSSGKGGNGADGVCIVISES